MALASKGTFMNITLADAAGNRSVLRLNLTYADLAALSTGVTNGDITGLLSDLEIITEAIVLGYSIGEAFAEDTNYYGAAGSEVENVALITARIDGTNKTANLRIPAPSDPIFLGTTGESRNIVDINNANVQAWLANFSTAGDNLATVSDGESLADPAVPGNWKGKRIHRGSRVG